MQRGEERGNEGKLWHPQPSFVMKLLKKGAVKGDY